MYEIIDDDIENLPKVHYFYYILQRNMDLVKIKPMIEKLSKGLDESKIIFYMVDADSNDGHLQDLMLKVFRFLLLR